MISNIEGVGSEVIQFFIFLGIVLICLLLWLSTRVRSPDEPFFSTVYVLERRYGRNNEETNRVPQSLENPTEGESGSTDSTSNRCVVTASQGSSSGQNVASSSSEGDPVVCNATCSHSGSESSRKSHECSSFTSSDTNSATKSDTANDDSTSNQIEIMIKVRLKYFTDESREVEGSLNERLSDFKRRNFPEELASGKIIRLIFNGRMLRDDNITLQNYGLFNDCVVHCLIGSARPQQPTTPEQSDQTQQLPQNNEPATVPEWNLSKLLCFIIVGILSITWYCRFQFATLFTFTSTSFLLGLTVIFLCSMFGTFYVDTAVPLNTVG